MQLAGRRATVMGLGRHGGGVAAARYLAELGAIVTVTDLAGSDTLTDSLAALAGTDIRAFHLGSHQEADFREAELLVVNPAVRPGDAFVKLAGASGALITSEIELFLDACPAPVIGVTGTVGKSTTAAMTAAILAAAGRRTWLGGNIGQSLLADLPQIRPDDWVVLELSSFQLHWLSANVCWPRMAVMTNFAPNHLDWHGSLEHYRSSKERLLELQHSDDVAIFDAADPMLTEWRPAVRGRFEPPRADAEIPPLRVPGQHNRANAALAAAAALAAGADRESVRRGLVEFTGLPHRLQLVAEVAGRRFYNDSKATTPEATLAALASMDRPTWVLLGGTDKQIDLAPLVAAVGRQARGTALFGAVAGQLDSLFAASAPHVPRVRTATLDEALAWCWDQSRAGEAILLSPACASLDQFRDYADRGERFVQLVGELRGG